MADSQWASLRLGDVCTKIGSGATPRGGSEVYVKDGPYALVRSQNVYNDGFHHDGLAQIGERHAVELAGVEILKDDILLNITGDSVARACQVDPHILPARVNQHVAIIRPAPEKLHARFLRYLLVSPVTQAKLLSWGSSGGTRNALTKGMIEALDVLAPINVFEQQTIAHILGTLDDKIELNRRMNETLESMARALFKSWFVDFDPVRAKAKGREAFYASELWSLFPGALDADDRPVGWPLGMLIDLCELKRGYDLPTAQRSPGKYPIVSSSGISGSHSNPMAEGPGVVTGRYGTIGEVYFISEAYWPLNTALYVRDFKGNSPRFIYYALRQVEFLQYSDKGAVPGINRNHLHQAPVILPPYSVQQAFELLLAPVWARQEINKAESATLTALRDTLLPKLISGELRVKTAEKMVEAVA